MLRLIYFNYVTLVEGLSRSILCYFFILGQDCRRRCPFKIYFFFTCVDLAKAGLVMGHSISLSIHPSIHPSIHLSIKPSIDPSICPCISLSICPSRQMSVHLYVCNTFLVPSLCIWQLQTFSYLFIQTLHTDCSHIKDVHLLFLHIS